MGSLSIACGATYRSSPRGGTRFGNVYLIEDEFTGRVPILAAVVIDESQRTWADQSRCLSRGTLRPAHLGILTAGLPFEMS